MSKSDDEPFMTIDEYLEFEINTVVRHEYVDGQLFAMSGATEAHNLISTNTLTILHTQIRSSDCRAYSNDMKVRIETKRSFYYPDIMVTCERYDPKNIFIDAPAILIEILSPSTKQIDRREKAAAYRQIASLKLYLLIHQDKRKVEAYSTNEDGQWGLTVYRGRQEILIDSLPCDHFSLSLDSIYERTGLSAIVEEGEESYTGECVADEFSDD